MLYLIMRILIVFVYFLSLLNAICTCHFYGHHVVQIVKETSISHIINLLFVTNIVYALMLDICTYEYIIWKYISCFVANIFFIPTFNSLITIYCVLVVRKTDTSA